MPIGCEYFNRVYSTPEGIDIDDFAAFDHCWTGSGAKYSVALPRGCNP